MQLRYRYSEIMKSDWLKMTFYFFDCIAQRTGE